MGLTIFRILTVALLLSFPFYPLKAQDNKELRILRVTPEGEDVEATRQLVIEFNRPVVPIGRMDRTAEEVGVTITPSINCQWRWLNTTSLSCNLSEKDALIRSTAYKMHIEPVIKAEDGASIAAPYDHSFITQRPNIEENYLTTWTSPGKPVFSSSFTEPVTKSSVEAHLYFEDNKTKTRYKVIATKVEDDEAAPLSKNGEEARYFWSITPAAEMPADSAITYKMEPGLVPYEGDQLSIAQNDLVQFYTYPAPLVKNISCTSRKGDEVIIKTDSPAQTEDTFCDPLKAIRISFASPVLRSQAQSNLVFSPDLTNGKKDVNPWGDNRDWSALDEDNRTEQDRDYSISLPYGLKAAQSYTISLGEQKHSLWEKIKAFFTGKKLNPSSLMADEFGRTVPPFKITFATGHRSPNYEMVYNDAVLEKNIDSEVPFYVNNLKNFTVSYNKIDSTTASSSEITNTVPTVEDKQFAVPLGVRSILNGKSGVVYAHVKTDPVVDGKSDDTNRLFAQITPYQIYAKMGHFQSAVWITDLATGNPVESAKVRIYPGELNNLKQPNSVLATVTTDKNGVAILPGTDTLDPDLFKNNVWKDGDTRLFIRVDKGDDMALLPISYSYAIQTWNISSDVYASNAAKYGHMKTWGMTAQGIYRAGDTMQYKIYVRDQNNDRFITPSDGIYTLTIVDPMGKTVETKEKLKLSAFGTLDGEYKIPETGAVGFYNFGLHATLDNNGVQREMDFSPLSVLVSDFTPAPFHVGTELNGDHFRAGDTLDITADAKLHSGGPYGNAAIRGTITLVSRHFSSNDPVAKDYRFDSFDGETDSENLLEKSEKLDDKGEWKTSFQLPEKDIVYGQLQVESAVRDERGKSVAAQARADYVGVDRLVGLMPLAWVYDAKKPATVKTIVVDDKGKPAPGTPIDLLIEKQEVVTAKVKEAGNAYTNDNTTEWKETAKCAVTSAAEGQDCTFTPDTAGTYRITAKIKDTKGHDHQSQQTLWVTGEDYVQWDEGSQYALTILPEKQEYKVGDTARYLVKNPYPGANALVTVERYGVMDTFVQKLEGSAPVVEIPIKPDYIPGFYVSIVVMSPRVEAPPPESGQIDMGKPGFRAGYVTTMVPDPYKQMTVSAKADQEIYRPRDKVKVSLEAKPLHEGETKEPIELAVAVLDESVFDLLTKGKDAFDPYKGFYSLDSLDVSNYSLLTRLIGRQKFEKKGTNPGGDGGSDVGMRNIFKFVSYWNPSVPLDKDGKANIEFDAPDNLTGWRILAIATTPTDKMGLGDANFKVNRPTEIRPVMPNQVHEGDNFSAGFSVMNRSDKKRTIKMTITASGDLKGKDTQTREETVTLEPYKRATVLMPLEVALLPVTREKPEGKISFKVTAGDETDRDGLEHSLPILKARTTETAATYGTSTENEVTQTFDIPKDIYTDTGDISAVLSPSVIANLDGAFKYMRDYPYPCWEQKLTMAVMSSQYTELKPYLDEKTVWDEAATLPEKILETASSYQAPNGGMAYFIAKDEYVDPYLSAYTALAFQWLKQIGHKVPEQVESNLDKYLLNFLRTDTAPGYYQDGMKSTVRAVILAALKDTGEIKKDDILRFQPHVKNMSLFGKAYYMQAANSFPETKDAAKEALNMILSSGVESGGKFSFNETYDDGYDRILATPLRDNCAILDTFMSYNDKELIGDKPFKLVRMITQARGNRDHWENTQENMFCMNALVDYAKKYENVKPAMSIKAAYHDKDFGTATFKDVKDKPVILSRPIEESDAGQKGMLKLTREGDGRYYYAARLRYAPKTIKESLNAGIDVHREYNVKKDGKWTLLTTPYKIHRGDLVKVDLYLSIPTARSFVVVNDPLPGGLETVNTQLATASQVDANKSLYDNAGGSFWFRFHDWREYNFSFWSFYHQELRNDSARFYSDWLDAGNYHLSYTAQAIATGTFSAPPTKAEEMYDPDVFGLGTKGEFVVEETP